MVAVREVLVPTASGVGHEFVRHPVYPEQLPREKLLFHLQQVETVFALMFRASAPESRN